MQRGRNLLMLVIALGVALTACAGTITRGEFDQEVRRRGGGFAQDQVLGAVAQVAERVGTEQFELTRLSVTPGPDVVSMQVRNPNAPTELDDHVIRRGELESTTPVRLTAGTDLDAQTFVISEVALDRLDEMVDAALDGYGAAGGYVTSVDVTLGALPGLSESPTVRVAVQMESPRSAATALFTPGGELVDVQER